MKVNKTCQWYEVYLGVNNNNRVHIRGRATATLKTGQVDRSFCLLSHWWKMEAEKEKPEIVWKAEKLVAATMGGRDASHDAAHAFRVRGLALSLAKEEALSGPSLEIVRIYLPILFSYFFLSFSNFIPSRNDTMMEH